MDLRRGDKCVSLSNLSIYYTWKNIKRLPKQQLQNIRSNINNLSYLMDPILYQILRTTFSISSRSMKRWQINHQSKYRSKKLRAEFKLLTPETIKWLKTTERRTTWDRNGQNIPQPEIKEVNIVNNHYQHMYICSK